jgi:hypothetical protein
MIQWAAHANTRPVQHVSVNHRRRRILVTEEFLYGANVVTVFEQVCCE